MIHPELSRVRHVAAVRAAVRALRDAHAEVAAVLAQHGRATWAPYDSPIHRAERALNEAVEDALYSHRRW